jgi:hypothetical protein
MIILGAVIIVVDQHLQGGLTAGICVGNAD